MYPTMTQYRNKLVENKKSYVFIVVFFLMASKGNSQSEKKSFSSRLYFPFGIGYLNSPANNLKPGTILNMGVEYRLQDGNHGPYLRLNLDNRSNSYQRDAVDGTNIVQGKIKFNDYIGGVGYRMGIGRRFRQFALLQGGLSVCQFQNVAESGQSYVVENKEKTIPVLKAAGGIEYYVGKSSAITLEAGYIWHLEGTPFVHNQLSEGAFGISIGFSSTLF